MTAGNVFSVGFGNHRAGIVTAGNLYIESTAECGNFDTGALQVQGGAYIERLLNVFGGIVTAGNVFSVGFGNHVAGIVTKGNIYSESTGECGGATTGALQVRGGAYIEKLLNVNGGIVTAGNVFSVGFGNHMAGIVTKGNIYSESTGECGGATTGSLQVRGGAYIDF